LKDSQTVWDIGAGTGSVSIEIARLCPNSQIYAIEKTAMGVSLIQRNCDRFQVNNINIFQGNAPEFLEQLPTPDRIFIGGSGGNLAEILSVCSHRVSATGSIVLAVATLEHLAEALNWVKTQEWYHHLLQISISRSVPIASLTRFSPLNPVTILKISNKSPDMIK
ncbi:MAG: precorrin-6Y C5,15-methyltransferase (decarboxylating) subunit CbiT, partial [Geitlerinemataceae cyanobacterium]